MPSERTGLQQPEQPVIDQRRDDRRRQFTVLLDLVRRRGESGPERAGARAIIRVVVQNLAHVSTSCLRAAAPGRDSTSNPHNPPLIWINRLASFETAVRASSG